MRKPASFLKKKPIVQKDRYELWRGVASLLGFKAQERVRVEWMVFYYTVGKKNAALTAQHFDISRKTFYKWSKRFKDSKYNVQSLADRSRAPHRKKHWEVTFIQEERIRLLRKRYPYYGKKKLKVLYEKEYSEEISTWKIERVVRRYKLYPDQNKAEKTARKRARARQKPKEENNSIAPINLLPISLQSNILRGNSTKPAVQCYLCGQPTVYVSNHLGR